MIIVNEDNRNVRLGRFIPPSSSFYDPETNPANPTNPADPEAGFQMEVGGSMCPNNNNGLNEEVRHEEGSGYTSFCNYGNLPVEASYDCHQNSANSEMTGKEKFFLSCKYFNT
jgi:hypothetical protein